MSISKDLSNTNNHDPKVLAIKILHLQEEFQDMKDSSQKCLMRRERREDQILKELKDLKSVVDKLQGGIFGIKFILLILTGFVSIISAFMIIKGGSL